jgi:hypothetical protein
MRQWLAVILSWALAVGPAWAISGSATPPILVESGIVRMQPSESIWIPAAGCSNATAASVFDLPTTNGAAAACYGTSPHRFGGLDFADGANALTATTNIVLPADWYGTSSAITLKWVWFWNGTGAGSTNNVAWTVRTACVGDTEVLTAPTYNTEEVTLDAAINTSMAQNSAADSGLITTGCAAGETLFLRIGRDPTNVSDTFAGTATLLGVVVTYVRNL